MSVNETGSGMEPEGVTGGRSRFRILVAEDDEELNDVLQYNLEQAGYQVLQVWDGREAMNAIERERPDLILLDMMMPGASGTDVCRFVTGKESLKDIPIVIYTARGSREDFDEVRQFNVAGFFTKPYGTGDVIRHVDKVLSGRGNLGDGSKSAL